MSARNPGSAGAGAAALGPADGRQRRAMRCRRGGVARGLVEAPEGLELTPEILVVVTRLGRADALGRRLETGHEACRHQYQNCTTGEQVVESLTRGAGREALEAQGVFVFKASFVQREISGFSLYGDEFPIIYLNNSVAKTRQIFTLFHELAHVLLQNNGVTKRNVSYISKMRGENRDVEIFCNAFAGEFLAPRDSLSPLLGRGIPPDETIGQIARELKVSREMILRRLLDLGVVSQRHYRTKAAEWTADYFDHQPSSPGGNYYNSQGAASRQTGSRPFPDCGSQGAGWLCRDGRELSSERSQNTERM